MLIDIFGIATLLLAYIAMLAVMASVALICWVWFTKE